MSYVDVWFILIIVLIFSWCAMACVMCRKYVQITEGSLDDMNIPRRQDVMTRIDKNEIAAVNAACDRIAKLLNEALAYPLVVDMEALGPTQLIRAKVTAKLEEAGWSVQREKNELGDFATSNYTIR